LSANIVLLPLYRFSRIVVGCPKNVYINEYGDMWLCFAMNKLVT